MQDSSPSFPGGFVFGVATSAYQVEGQIENDWTEWERAGKLREPHHRCDRAVDHWSPHRFEEDLQLARNVGSTAFRVSLEWARIEPRRGELDEAAIDAYRTRLVRMKEAGLRPVVTLHHFTHPSWFHRETPWYSPECLPVWRRYAKVCAKILKGLDALVMTFNEPMVLLMGGYLQGLIPPGIKSGKQCMAALANVVRCHVAAREELLAECGPTTIGISQNMVALAPDRPWHPLDRALVHLASHNYNHAVLEALTTGRIRIVMPGVASLDLKVPGARDSIEYIGMNYYTRAHMRFTMGHPFVELRYRDRSRRGLTDNGWEVYPEGFSQILLELKRYGLPVWVTENGIDDRNGGKRRVTYLHQHWSQLLEAARQGLDVRGYLYWSLMDNFEWLDGWGPRFGLYHVDFETLDRRETPACRYFRNVALSNKLIAPEPAAPQEEVARAPVPVLVTT